MSYALAYTTHFHSLDNTLWDIEIYINGYNARPLEICLEGDEPCIIEWQETGKMDVVQSSTCTLRVSNENDRQMVQLMNHPDAAVLVSRNGKWYWWGHLDDAVYEEPYSFKKAYVTELTFSDFGILNRIPFRLTGKQSVGAIVRDSLDSIGYGSGATINLYTSLLDPSTQQPITLDLLYINADRFKSEDESWGDMTSKREVLEEILRPLGLRIMQKNAQIYIYDIEYLRDHDFMHNYIVWKGIDAYLRGSETYGWYEVGFEPDAKETLAEDPTKIELESQTVPAHYRTLYYDEDWDEWGVGFYIWLEGVTGTDAHHGVRPFKTRPFLTSGSDMGYAWIVRCQNRIGQNVTIPPLVLGNSFVTWPVVDPQGTSPVAEAIFSIESSYLPLVPDWDKYQLRVNLDLLLSPKQNPFEETAEWNLVSDYTNLTPSRYEDFWTKMLVRANVPVKLELLNDDDTVAMHYTNMRIQGYPYVHRTLPIGSGLWENGPADFGDMMLAYYNDGYKTTALEGWATNRQSMPETMSHQPSLYAKRDQGEYVPMPPMAGRLRLTVSNCVYFPVNYLHSAIERRLCWHLLKNAKVTLVKANTVGDSIPADTVYDRDAAEIRGDKTSETLQANTWEEGVAPSARGLYFNEQGIVYEQFLKNGRIRTLSDHRLRCHEDQTFYPQPVISGTAEININFKALTDASTPGVFLVTAQRQDLHQGIEELTMARIAEIGRFVYETRWSCPVCVREEIVTSYNFVWSHPVCSQEEQ